MRSTEESSAVLIPYVQAHFRCPGKERGLQSYLFKVVDIALENLHTPLLGGEWSNVPNAHCTETQTKVKQRSSDRQLRATVCVKKKKKGNFSYTCRTCVVHGVG